MIGLGKLGYLGKMGNVSSGGTALPEVQASGRSFPIWNTIAGDDKLLSLSIHGRTEQDGTPTPEASVPLQSVGDEDLYLYVMQDKEGSNFQTLDIKTAMQNAGHDGILRSVNGIYDEVFYDGKQWKLIQRIQYSSNLEILAEPQEYSLDLPQISTYEGQTYFATNTMEIKPRMVAQCQVSEKLDYIKEGLLGYWTGRERSNTDENKNILPDLSGNGNDLENKNFAYTVDSGYGDGYIQYDGIDDFSGLKTSIPATKRTVLFTVSDIHRLNENSNAWCGLIDGQNYFLGINNGTGFTQSGRYIINGVVSKDNFNILDKGDNIYVAGTTDNIGSKQIDNITIGSTLNRSLYACKCKIYDVLLYDRILTDEEIAYNYKVSRQLNGEDFSFDPVEQSLVASYRTYDKKNEDEDRDILKDLSGNGHDIQLHNFAFSEGSGYGLYGDQFDTLKTHNNSVSKTYKKIEVTKELTSSYIVYNKTGVTSLNGMKVKVSNLPKERTLIYVYKEADDANSATQMSIVADGIYDLPGSVKTSEGSQNRDCGFIVDRNNIIGFVGLTIELIPDYQGALVSDGIDDFGICENFPAFPIEKGFTICAIREDWKGGLISNAYLVTKAISSSEGEFMFESSVKEDNLYNIYSYGAGSSYINHINKFSYLTSNSYNGNTITKGESTNYNADLNLFRLRDSNTIFRKAALYALEIYDRDLTDEEIAKVKARMIAEYEEKTGNKYEEENI